MTEHPPQDFGVPETELNHRFTLFSAWFGPVYATLQRSRALSVAAALLLFSSAANAEENDSAPSNERTDNSEEESETSDASARDESDARFGERMLVEEDEAVHIAGSAHRVDEAMMELFDYNDIQQVLGQIPGVVARGEDGFGLRPNIGIRGANSDRSAKITLLEDGLPLSPAPYAAPAAYYFPLSPVWLGLRF